MNKNKKTANKYLDAKKPEVKEEYDRIPNARNRKFGDSYVGKRNDLSWYTVNEQVLKDVARLQYAIPTGTPVRNDGTLTGTVVQHSNFIMSNPGIVTMEIVPTIGNAKEAMDPVNAAANGQFTYLRSQVTGNVRFEQNDVMIYNIVVDSVYYYMAWLHRLYKSLPVYHQATRYVPRTLIECQGVDYDDLLENAAKFRAELNKRAPLIANLKIPKALYIFPRHKWLFENYFIESETEKSQLYMYRPAAIYTYELDSNGAGMAKCHRILTNGSGQSGRLTTSDMIRKLDTMLNPIYDDEFFNIISGYMEKAYNDFLAVETLEDQPLIPIVYSPDVLLQFKNAKTFSVMHDTLGGSGYEDGFFDIVQRINSGSSVRMHLETLTPDSALNLYRELPVPTAIHVDNSSTQLVKNSYQNFWNEWSKDTLLTSPHADVTPGENMINTRLTLAFDLSYDSSALSNVKINKIFFGSEWPLEIQTFTRVKNRSNGVVAAGDHTFNTVMVVDTSVVNLGLMFNNVWPTHSVFKYLPELKLPYTDGTDHYSSEMTIFEVDNYTYVDAQTIGAMHDAALLAEFRLPEIAVGKL